MGLSSSEGILSEFSHVMLWTFYSIEHAWSLVSFLPGDSFTIFFHMRGSFVGEA
jgi:hypothetical protein